MNASLAKAPESLSESSNGMTSQILDVKAGSQQRVHGINSDVYSGTSGELNRLLLKGEYSLGGPVQSNDPDISNDRSYILLSAPGKRSIKIRFSVEEGDVYVYAKKCKQLIRKESEIYNQMITITGIKTLINN